MWEHTNRTPPPGPNRRTLGAKPLYKAANPSSLNTTPRAGYAQLYLGMTPGWRVVFWIRDFTTSWKSIRLNEKNKYEWSIYQCTHCSTDRAGNEIVGKFALFRSCLWQPGTDRMDTSEIPCIPPDMSTRQLWDSEKTAFRGEGLVIPP